MKNILNDNSKLLDRINCLWAESEDLRKQFYGKREEAAKELQEIIRIVVDKAKEAHGQDAKVVPEPVVENNKIRAIKLWINDHCQIIGL